MNFKLTLFIRSNNHHSTNNIHKLLALSCHIDNMLIIQYFVSPHYPYAPCAQCTLECVGNELGFGFIFFTNYQGYFQGAYQLSEKSIRLIGCKIKDLIFKKETPKVLNIFKLFFLSLFKNSSNL